MMRSLPIPKIQLGRTFFVASAILVLGGVAQVVALGWKYLESVRERRMERTAMEANQVAAPGSAVPQESGWQGLPDELRASLSKPELPVMPGDRPVEAPRPTPVSMTRRTPSSAGESPALGLIAQARILRQQGDTATALVRLKEALTMEPGSAEGTVEMALTYEAMGLKDKAMEYWRGVFEKGEAAGVYFTVAEAKLKQVEQQGVAPREAVQPGSSLGIVEIGETDSSTQGAGIRKSISIPMRAKEGEKIDVKDVVIQVYFYDQLEDGSILQTNANVSSKWTTVPVDWLTSEPEVLEVEYSDEVAPEGSKRKYHGYVVRLYYRSELQDWRAEPEDLRKQFPPPLNLLNDTSP